MSTSPTPSIVNDPSARETSVSGPSIYDDLGHPNSDAHSLPQGTTDEVARASLWESVRNDFFGDGDGFDGEEELALEDYFKGGLDDDSEGWTTDEGDAEEESPWLKGLTAADLLEDEFDAEVSARGEYVSY